MQWALHSLDEHEELLWNIIIIYWWTFIQGLVSEIQINSQDTWFHKCMIYRFSFLNYDSIMGYAGSPRLIESQSPIYIKQYLIMILYN